MVIKTPVRGRTKGSADRAHRPKRTVQAAQLASYKNSATQNLQHCNNAVNSWLHRNLEVTPQTLINLPLPSRIPHNRGRPPQGRAEVDQEEGNKRDEIAGTARGLCCKFRNRWRV